KAQRAAPDDAEVRARARRLLAYLVPSYHIPMMNDGRRNSAWQSVLGRRMRPGIRALGIGTGAGMLALMAAKAGAELVMTCEQDPVRAAIAGERAARNGLAAKKNVLATPPGELKLGEDIARPADLLFCDLFGAHLVNLSPFEVIADARLRLTTRDATVI